MLEIRGDLFTFGGIYKGKQKTSIHRITCFNHSCHWTTINQKLKNPRYSSVAIPVAYCYTHTPTNTTIPALNTARIKTPQKTLNPTTTQTPQKTLNPTTTQIQIQTQTTNTAIMTTTTTSSKEKSNSVL